MALSIKEIQQYKSDATTEAKSILDWWTNNMQDEKNGGFYGSIDNDGNINNAAKGIVLNARICWTFATGYLYFNDEKYLAIAECAYNYIKEFFLDKKYGGVYWSVDKNGKILDGKKQIYGLAFTIYGLAELYKANKNDAVIGLAKELFLLIEKYSLDKNKGGYIEAFARDWSSAGDLRLSEKDDNEKKTMNTHLHIIEAYANLYSVWKNDMLKDKILHLLDVFEQHIINQNHHLNLFFDEDWILHSSAVSFGHDIESAWLLQECAEIVEEEIYINRYKNLSVNIADASLDGWDNKSGGIWYEYEPKNNYWIKEKHWWPQAEAMVGFWNAYQISANEKYAELSIQSFNFIRENLMDKKCGEWFWGIEQDGTLMNKEKAGFWKCPYHNTRACLEIAKRIKY